GSGRNDTYFRPPRAESVSPPGAESVRPPGAEMRSTTALPPPSDGARGSRPPGRGTQPPGRGVVYRGPGEPTRTAPHHHRDRLGPGDPDRRARPQPADGAADRGAGSVGRRAARGQPPDGR